MPGPKQLAAFIVIDISLTVLAAGSWAKKSGVEQGICGVAESEGTGQSSSEVANSFPVAFVPWALRENMILEGPRYAVRPDHPLKMLPERQDQDTGSAPMRPDIAPMRPAMRRSVRDGFPKELEMFENPKRRAEGSFGSVWSATHKGEPVVVKLVTFEEKQFLTWDLASEMGVEHLLHNAAKECANAQNMRHGGLPSDEGSKYIVDCYFDNIYEPTSGSDPLYLVMEDCGEETLGDFCVRHVFDYTWTPELVMDIYVQLLEAVAYLGRHPAKWVHHDLKPDNIVIKTTPEGETELRLVDAGDAVTAESDQFTITASTPGYRPPEYRVEATYDFDRMNFMVSADDVDGRAWKGYDMFMVVSTLVQLIGGTRPFDLIVSRPEDFVNLTRKRTRVTEQLVYERLERALKNPAQFVSNVGDRIFMKETYEEFTTEGTFFNKVLVKSLEGLSSDPLKRPTAKEMLAFIETERESFGL